MMARPLDWHDLRAAGALESPEALADHIEARPPMSMDLGPVLRQIVADHDASAETADQ